MKFTALAFLTVAFCVTVQADKHHGTDCYDLAHKISKSLEDFEHKLFDVIDGKHNKHNEHVKKLEKHGRDVSIRIEEYVAVGCKAIPQIDFYLAEAKAECSQIESDYARFKQFPNPNPLIKSTTETVISECGKINA